jgi:cbb3-type cytochrome c oxidase subunit III
MKRISLACALLAVTCSSIVAAEVSEPQSVYQAKCSACHGTAAQGNSSMGAPGLAGQTAFYLAEQLRQFREGRRGTHPGDTNGQVMRTIAMGLKEEQLDSLSSLLSEMENAPITEDLTGNSQRGQALYASTCASCHGASAEGNSHLGAPNLRVLSYWYTRHQIIAYREGWRGKDSAGNIKAVWMRGIAAHIEEDSIQDISLYVQSLRETDID